MRSHRAARYRRELPGIPDALAADRASRRRSAKRLARLDRRRKKRTSNRTGRIPRIPTEDHEDEGRAPHTSRTKPSMPSIWITPRSCGHAARRRRRDTTSLVETASRPRNKSRPRTPRAPRAALTEIVADKGFHSNQTMIDLEASSPYGRTSPSPSAA